MSTEKKQEVLNHLEELISERIVDVIGVYCSDKWKNLTRRLVEQDPTTLASEIAEAVSKGVTASLANDSQWPNECKIPTQFNEIVVSAAQVALIINCCWYINAAQFTQLRYERLLFPGWTYDWVLKQARATGACVHNSEKFNGMSVAEDLNFVVIRYDGSGITVFNDGREVVTPALPVSKHRPIPVTRIGKPKEMYGAYMTATELEERIAAKSKAKDNNSN